MLNNAKVCMVCGEALSFHQQMVGNICGDWSCRREHMMQDQSQQLEIKGALKTLAEERRQRVAKILGIDDETPWLLALLPVNNAVLNPLPQARRDRLHEHLGKLCQDVLAQPVDETAVTAAKEQANPVEDHVLGHACATCQGFCCRGGGNHAYIKAETIQRYRAAHPDAQAADIVAAYMERLSAKTYADSCVFHGERGCGLPREMRSKTCNDHFCSGLRALQNDLRENAATRLTFAVAARHTQIVHWAVFDGEKIHYHHPEPTGS